MRRLNVLLALAVALSVAGADPAPGQDRAWTKEVVVGLGAEADHDLLGPGAVLARGWIRAGDRQCDREGKQHVQAAHRASLDVIGGSRIQPDRKSVVQGKRGEIGGRGE